MYGQRKEFLRPRPDFMPVPGPGTLVFMTVDDVEVATLTFSKPAFGAAVDGQAVARAYS
jgi:hypothetical protein